MNLKERELAAQMLDAASDEYSDHGCNDWNFPSDWTHEERLTFVKDYHDFNGNPGDFLPTHLHLPDFAVMSFLAHKLRMET